MSGNITQAAEKLCISQPAVSQAVKQLETTSMKESAEIEMVHKQ